MYEILGYNLKNSALISFVTAAAFLTVAFISPLLSGIADYVGNKKSFMQFFCYLCNIFICSECVKSKKENKGFDALVHREHYLIAFQNPDPNNLKNIEKYKLGKNLFASISEEELNRSVCGNHLPLLSNILEPK